MTSETKSQAISIVDGTTEWTAHELYKMIPDQMLAFVQNVETQPAHVLKKLLELMSKDTSRLDGRTASVMGGATIFVHGTLQAKTTAAIEPKPSTWEVQQCFMNSTEYGESLKNGYEPFAVTKEGPYTTVWLKRQAEQPL